MGNSEKIILNRIFLSRDDIEISIYEKYKPEEEKITLGEINNFDLKGIKDSTGSIEFYPNPRNGFYKLRLKEIKKYCIKTNSTKLELTSNFTEKIYDDLYVMQVINYLGKTSFTINDLRTNQNYNIDFEIVPDKIDYETDYVKLTEDIADHCAALLLDYASPTNLKYTDDSTKPQRTPLESFIFLRKFCSNDNIETIFSNIKNNPDTKFVSEEEMKPFGTAPISKKIFSNPFSNAKMWTDVGNDKYIPQFINTTRKYDSFDTVANRFIKFAFNSFIMVCNDIINHLKNTHFTYEEEAKCLKENLENILNDSFFTDIQDLQQMPNNNQVLQKREGYYQVFSAFAMIDLAKQLDWKEQDKVYDGKVKDIASLYEYWLVFQFIDILKSKEIGGKFDIGTTDDDIIQKNKDGKLLINLKRGTESKISFKIESRGIEIDFYYNRTFKHKTFNDSIYEHSSYSSDFRPDYTLEIYPYCDVPPKKYTRKDAIKDGAVSFVHFDAKYRVNKNNLPFGELELNENELNEEKSDSSIDTYKRGDLLKMHTYNDAIRRTIGSYVLYPGDKNKQYEIYDEVLPGVGAFPIKPSDVINGKNTIKEFIIDIIDFKSKPFSKQYRKNYFENIIIKATNLKPIEKLYMIGFMRKGYINKLEELGKIPKDENTKISKDDYFYFYYHAIEQNGIVQAIHKDINKASKFCAYSEDFKFLNFEANVESIELIDKETLIKRIHKYDEPKKDHNALYYYIVKLTNIEYKKHSETIDNISIFGKYGISPFTPIVKYL